MATHEEFRGLEVRAGTILSAERLKGARMPTLTLRIDFGVSGQKTGTAEITDLYDPDELVGLQVAAVVNLPPRRVAGVSAEVLVLTLDNGRGEHTLLIPERPVPDGAKLS